MLCSLIGPDSPSVSTSAYVLQVKVEMELEIQQCEKTKAVREEQLERLTQICQEQAVSRSCCRFRSLTLKKAFKETTIKQNTFPSVEM